MKGYNNGKHMDLNVKRKTGWREIYTLIPMIESGNNSTHRDSRVILTEREELENHLDVDTMQT